MSRPIVVVACMTWLLRIVEALNSAHFHGTPVPVEEPTARQVLNGLVKRCFRQGVEPYLHLYPHSGWGSPRIDVTRPRQRRTSCLWRARAGVRAIAGLSGQLAKRRANSPFTKLAVVDHRDSTACGGRWFVIPASPVGRCQPWFQLLFMARADSLPRVPWIAVTTP
jgi:hypothetical protein